MLECIDYIQGQESKENPGFILDNTEGEQCLPSTYDKEVWLRIEEVLNAEFDDTSSKFSREEAYQDVEDLCLLGSTSFLYHQVRKLLDVRVSQFIQAVSEKYKQVGRSSNVNDARSFSAFFSSLQPSAPTVDGPVVFAEWLDGKWLDFKAKLNAARQVLMCFDRNYIVGLPIDNAKFRNHGGILGKPAVSSLFELGLAILQSKLLDKGDIIRTCGFALAEVLHRRRLSILSPVLPISHPTSTIPSTAPNSRSIPFPNLRDMLTQTGHYEMTQHQAPLLALQAACRAARVLAFSTWYAPHDYLEYMTLCVAWLKYERRLWSRSVSSGDTLPKTADAAMAIACRELVISGSDLLHGDGFSWLINQGLRRSMELRERDEGQGVIGREGDVKEEGNVEGIGKGSVEGNVDRNDKTGGVEKDQQEIIKQGKKDKSLTFRECVQIVARLNALLTQCDTCQAFLRGTGSDRIQKAAKEFVGAAADEQQDQVTAQKLLALKFFLNVLSRFAFVDGGKKLRRSDLLGPGQRRSDLREISGEQNSTPSIAAEETSELLPSTAPVGGSTAGSPILPVSIPPSFSSSSSTAILDNNPNPNNNPNNNPNPNNDYTRLLALTDGESGEEGVLLTRQVLQAVMNEGRPGRFSEVIAKYLDRLIRSEGQSKMGEEGTDSETVEQIKGKRQFRSRGLGSKEGMERGITTVIGGEKTDSSYVNKGGEKDNQKDQGDDGGDGDGDEDGQNKSMSHTRSDRSAMPSAMRRPFVKSDLICLTLARDFESKLNEAFLLFHVAPGKDFFEAFYRRDLARRLLSNIGFSFSRERKVVKKIEAECGSGFTMHIEGMLKDIEMSKSINKAYRAAFNDASVVVASSSSSPSSVPTSRLFSLRLPLNKRKASEIDSKREAKKENVGKPGVVLPLSLACPGITAKDTFVHVITSGFWPVQNALESFNVPQNLMALESHFEAFYLGRYANRKLLWLRGFGSCVLTANFPAARKELIGSLSQAAILLLFNGDAKLSYAEIRKLTNLNEKDLRWILQGLSGSKYPILIRNERFRLVDNHTFTVNNDFKNDSYQIRIQKALDDAAAEEDDKRRMREEVVVDRGQQIEAAIVRIVKLRRAIMHEDLIAALTAILRFPAALADIEKYIDSLISREYFARGGKDKYIYLP